MRFTPITFWLAVLFTFFTICGYSQHVKKFSLQKDSIQLDTNSIAPSSLIINGVDSSQYQLLPASALLIWKEKPKGDSIEISYIPLPINFEKRHYHKSISDYNRVKSGAKNPFKYTTLPATNSGSFSQLDKRGSISRGINFGNSQNLGVNSNLNLELAGKLTDEITLTAAISDENIPIQPDGNTQQIQDFDQVYIKLASKNSSLTAGDFQTESNNSYFLKYNKRLRGGAFETRFPLKNGAASNKLGLGAAISRGKFARNIIQGTEGNQGPYRLEGAENESFIIILSGTERVFIDGKELSRGQAYDYIIDYNKAEITFTAKQPITKDKRIIVEFQYAGQAYSRSLITFRDQLTTEKLALNLNIYAEQDSKNQPLQQDLTDEERNILIQAGDNSESTLAPGYEIVGFENDQIRYKLITDSLPNGTIDSIFVYSTNPDSAIYEVRFTETGLGNGNYVQIQSSGNGQVYEYIAPINGVPQGSYAPVISLVTPKLRQMMSLGGSYKIGKYSTLNFEGALSRNDLNTFSSTNDQDNFGTAFLVEYNTKKYLKNDTNNWALIASIRHEQQENTFEEIEFFRTAEFDRDWNIRDLELSNNQYLPAASIGLQKTEVGTGVYEFQTLLAGNQYQAQKHGVSLDFNTNLLEIEYTGSLTKTSGNFFKSQFNRHKTAIAKPLKYFKIGYRDDLEQNKQYNPETDSLLATSYQFWEWEAFIASLDQAQNTFKLSYTERNDYGGLNNELAHSTFGRSYGLEYGLKKNKFFQVTGKTTYRELQVKNNELYQNDPEENLISRIEYNLQLLKGGLSANGFYEIGTGLEEQRDFVYVEVSPGQGVYAWTDYNQNGIKELDEFDIAQFQDQANYVRVTIQTNNFVKTYTNQFNQVLFLQPDKFLKKDTPLHNTLSRFSNQIAYRIERKTTKEDDLNRFNPFYNQIADSNILSTNSSFRNTLYFNRTNQKFGGEYSYTSSAVKSFLTDGLDGTNIFKHLIDFRYNFTAIVQLNLLSGFGKKESTSSFFTDRNYTLKQEEYGPKLTLQPNARFNVIGSFARKTKENIAAENGELSTEDNAGLELRWNQPGKGSLNAKINFVVIEFKGDILSPIAYEMLQGLLPGNNGTWEVSYQRTLGNNLQLNLTYNGRKSEETNTIHSGGVQVRAFF